jgi:type I restriction enzyme S subunit
MKKYQSYKYSGVEWIGEIPSSWSLLKIKYLGNIVSGGTPSTDKEEYWNGSIPWLQSGKVHYNFIKSNDVDKYITELGLMKSSTKMVLSNSVLVAITGATCGNIGYLTFDSTVNQSIIGIEPSTSYSPEFIFYFLSSQRHQILYHQSGGAQGGVNKDDVKNLFISIPTLDEQNLIVQFLDKKTEFIDRLISTKERKITLLKEQRTLLINQVVTKGLNSNVKMKDSGVEWIGEIPEMWLMGKIKFLSEIISKGTTPSTVGREVLEVGNIFYVKVENIKEGYVGVPPSYFIDEETDKILSRSSLKENDILVVITGSTIGKVVILPKEFTPSNTNQGISFVRLKNKSNVRFVWYWLSTEIIQDRIKVVCTQSTQPNLSMEDLGNFSIPLPSELEQLQIVEYLDSKTKEIDDLVKLEQKKIDLLKQYRQSLISEVVTGKIKVTTDE